MAAGDGHIAEFTGTQLLIRDNKWHQQIGAVVAQTECTSLAQADAAANRLGFTLRDSWEDCGNRSKVREAYPNH
jgi:hypothetical protein